MAVNDSALSGQVEDGSREGGQRGSVEQKRKRNRAH